MANPTSIVQSIEQQADDIKGYWPVNPTNLTTFQTGELIGVGQDGYANHFDDTQVMKQFLGLFDGLHQIFDSTSPVPQYLRYKRPYRFAMPLLSGTASRVTNLGANVYAPDSGHVQIAATVNSNIVGTIVDITGGTPNFDPYTALTGAGVWIKPAANSA